MTERWPKVVNLILAVFLLLTVVAFYFKGIEVKTLRSANEQTLQTLQNQTQLIVDLRLELAGLHYRNFESEQGLRDWVNYWVLTKMPVVIEFLDTSIELRGEKYSEYFDCDDPAEAMQRDALRDGYLMSVVLVDANGCIYGVKVSDSKSHAGSLAMTDNAYWYVEPQTGQVAKIVGRD